MKVPPTTVIRFANLLSLVSPGKNKVGFFLDRPHMDKMIHVGVANHYDSQSKSCYLRNLENQY
jgi:hypothetical protein